MSRIKPSPGQLSIDWDRGAQLDMLDRLPIESGDTQDGQCVVRVSGGTAKSVLRAMEAHARTSGQSYASASCIAREINRSERTVRRAFSLLVDLELVIVEKRPGRTDRYAINWGEISLKVSQSNPGHSFANPGQFDSDPGQFDVNPGHYVRRSVSKRKEKRPPPAPKPVSVSCGRSDATEPRASWEEVAAVLCELLGDWRRVLRSCQQSGVGPQHVLHCIAHFQQLGARVGPGALYWRLRNCHPNLAADAGWQVELPKPQTAAKPNPEMIRHRVVMDGRKAGASDQRIAEVLRDRLVAAGLAPDVVEV